MYFCKVEKYNHLYLNFQIKSKCHISSFKSWNLGRILKGNSSDNLKRLSTLFEVIFINKLHIMHITTVTFNPLIEKLL